MKFGVNVHILVFFLSIVKRFHEEVKLSWFYFYMYTDDGFALVLSFFQDIEKGLACSVAPSLSPAGW